MIGRRLWDIIGKKGLENAMELIIKKFDELSLSELYEIMSLRVAVFVVEQNCPYQDLDGKDKYSRHLFLRDSEGIQAYLRAVPEEDGMALIGRVIAVKRRQGLASRLLEAGKELCRSELGAKSIRIEAQTYAVPLYEKAGFRQVSEEFLEDGIPHIMMRLDF